MCVAAVAWQAHPDWPLVAIGNRDEFHARPAAALAHWNDGSGIIAGRDLQSGGTWLGVAQGGRFVLVTNLRGHGASDPASPSRGGLVASLLSGDSDPANTAALALERYNPCNLVCVDRQAAHFLTNRPKSVSTRLGHGIYGLSNGLLDEPWPKTLQLKAALVDWLAAGRTDLAPLFATLASETLPDIGLHPQLASDIAIEPADTPPFIRHPQYGTRCSTVVAVNRHGRARMVERRFSPEGAASGETALEFEW